MLRIALFANWRVVALYLVWNFLQLLFGSYQDRRPAKNKKRDGPRMGGDSPAIRKTADLLLVRFAPKQLIKPYKLDIS
jgi:hypothetical protein